MHSPPRVTAIKKEWNGNEGSELFNTVINSGLESLRAFVFEIQNDE